MDASRYKRAVALMAIGACLTLWACGPEPGTPEYILAKIREGRVVGGKNLKQLKEAHLDQMAALLDDEGAPGIARLQVLERMIQFQLDDDFERFGKYAHDDNPELRLRIVQWLSQRKDPASARLLMDRIAVEEELAVRANGVQGLKQIGRSIAEPDPELIAQMIDHLEDADADKRRLWASVLGGWHGQDVEAALVEALEDPEPKVRAAAARSITGPVVRGLARVAPLYVSMLQNSQAEVRSAGISGLSHCSFPRRFSFKGSKCAEQPMLNLLEVVPELPEALAAFRGRADLTTKDKRLVTELAACIEQFAGTDAGVSASNPGVSASNPAGG